MQGFKRFMLWAFGLLVLAALTAIVVGWSYQNAKGSDYAPFQANAVYAPNGVVTTSQPLASQAGLAVLQRGAMRLMRPSQRLQY